MKWNKYRLATTTEAVDLISYTLAEMGIEGIEIEDKVPLSEEDKKEKILENQKIIRTPIVRNGKQATVGYEPDVWKDWK